MSEFTTLNNSILLHQEETLLKPISMYNKKYTEVDTVAHGRNLELVRKKHKLTQEEISEIIGIGRTSYNNVVKQHQMYKLNHAQGANFMRHFEVDFFWLYFNEGTYEESQERYHLAEKRTKPYMELESLEAKFDSKETIEKELRDRLGLQAKLIEMLEQQVESLKAQLDECRENKKATP